MGEEDDNASHPQGVGNLAQLFESRASEFAGSRATVYEPSNRANLSAPTSRRTSRHFDAPTPSIAPPSYRRPQGNGITRNVPSVLGTNLRERSISEGSVLVANENAQDRRISVARLSRFFEPGQLEGLPTQVGRGSGAGGLRPPSIAGMPKASSLGHLPTSPTSPYRRAPPPKPVKPASLSARSSVVLSRPPSQISQFSHHENPFVGEDEQDSDISISVPTHVAVADRIASLNQAAVPLLPKDSNRFSTYSTYSTKPHSPITTPTPRPSIPLTTTHPTSQPPKKIPPPVPPSPAARKAMAAQQALQNGPPSTPSTENGTHADFGELIGHGLPAGYAASRTASTNSVVTSAGDADEEGKAAKMAKKRVNIVTEMVETERQFLSDMEVLMEVCLFLCCGLCPWNENL